MQLLDYTFEEIEKIVLDLGEPRFRAKQLFEWLTKGAEFEEMKTLPKSFLDKLKEKGYTAQAIHIEDVLVSKLDGTKKYIYRLDDGNIIEGVLMKYKYGNTICVSTQVGCRMNCAFCASGLDGLIRNLTPGEILGQVVAVNKDNKEGKDRAITNIVLMGSGEPLDNYDNVTKFLDLVNSEKGLNISMRNISLSTCGLCDKIYKLADDGYHVTLTISLHAPDNESRLQIMPITKKYTVEDIKKAVEYYFEKTGRRIVFEYAMVAGKNDSISHAQKLVSLLRGLPCHVNIIPLNYVKERGLMGTSNDAIKKFMDYLEKNKISATRRRTMGADIEGACGQLRRKYLKDTNE
ncbi:MAG: 23S rRNA (adenine(2503)-C(2))-methyltransferase RlmN [Clostridia bacterium]|nr:23S rRNA (adenine(2503)-C(2))-methyltransferase RlmN [Clostridia bacterium]